MELINEEVENYAAFFTDDESELLAKIKHETYLYISGAQMLSGKLQGRLLAFISKILRPSKILEIGTYTGYSALCMAEGLGDKGLLYTIDHDEELKERVSGYFSESPYKDQIIYKIAEASTTIPYIEETFDLVFIDADKENYSLYYDQVFPKVSKGGIIIADNVLWKGKVLNKNFNDKSTRSIIDFNNKIKEDPKVDRVMLTIRDGLMLIRKNYE